MRAKITINQEEFSKIESGLLIFVGVSKGDIVEHADWLAKKTLNMRIFTDENDRLNRSILDCGAEMLVVSQFTLAADYGRGNRPSFTNAADPKLAKEIYETYVEKVSDSGLIVRTGSFGTNMKVELVNDGPVTFVLDRVL